VAVHLPSLTLFLAINGAPDVGPALPDDVLQASLSTAPEAPEEASEPAPPTDGAASVEAPPPSTTKREWMLVIAPGFDYIRGPQNAYTALGGGFRFGGHAMLLKGHFLVGGGPVLHYSFFKDKVANDTLHLVTVNGDLLLGGGGPRWGVYWHLTAGLGYLAASDGQTGTKIGTVGARGAAGVGGYGKVHDRFSIGALVDFGWAGGLWVNALVTANIHFGRRGDPL
jgi:hypothetical protein